MLTGRKLNQLNVYGIIVFAVQYFLEVLEIN